MTCKVCWKLLTRTFGDCSILKDLLNSLDSFLWLPVKGVDAILRGVSQVVFASNPISGALILAGLFTVWDGQEVWQWEVGVAVLACSLVALLTAVLYQQPRVLVQDGITQFNAVLVGSVVFSLYPLLYQGLLDQRTWVMVLVGSAASVFVQTALGNFLASIKAPFVVRVDDEHGPIKKEFGIPSLTLPFNIVCCVVMAILVKTRDETTLTDAIQPNVTLQEINDPKVNEIEWERIGVGAVLSMGQVYGVETLIGSILMYIGVAIFSPILAIVEFLGAFIGSIVALYLTSPPYDMIYAGVWGYCPLLTAGAVGGFFVVLTPSSIPVTLLAIISTCAVQSFLIPVLQVVDMPVFTIPFVLTTWIFLLLTTENSAVVRTENISIPEAHLSSWFKQKKHIPLWFTKMFKKKAKVYAEKDVEDHNQSVP
jgi:urea transporter